MTERDKKSSAGAYAEAGVDIAAGDALVDRIKPFAKATARAGTTAALGGFGGLFDLKAAGFIDPVLVASNDGVGTKLKIAIETGMHADIGIDLVAMCVNDVVVQGAEPLFFLDYFACGQLHNDVAAMVIEGIAKGCTMAGCALIGGETAEMPGLYAGADYDLAGFCVGAAERGNLLPRNDIEPGDLILGIASSGVHSNGFSLVRRIARETGCTWKDEAPFAQGSTLGAAFLTPTSIYVKAALSAHRTGRVKAFAHVTGGGLPGNLPRVLPENTAAAIDLAAWKPHPVFLWLAASGKVPEEEMLKTFNCGIGFIAVVEPGSKDAITNIFESCGHPCQPIGIVEKRDSGGSLVRFNNALSY